MCRGPRRRNGRRRPDRPLCCGTVLALAGKRVAEIETAWGDHVGPEAFDSAMRVLDRLVTALDEERGGRDA
jgi:hypothetical protein